MLAFARGFMYLLTGFSLITKPGLRRYVLIPLLLNIIIFSALFMVLTHFVAEFNIWFNHYLPTWLHWLSAVLWVLFFISFFFAILYTFTALGNIICAPFNSLLSEKVESYLTGVQPVDVGLLSGIKDAPRAMGRQLATLAYYVPRAVGMLLLFLVPVVQTIAPFLWLAFNAWYIALIYIDYPTDNKRIPFQESRNWMAQHRLQSLGLGAGMLIVSSIPGLNFFAIPASVAAATLCWVRGHPSNIV